MSAKSIVSLMVGITLSLFLIGSTHAADKEAKADEEMQAKMAKAKEAGTPGAEHAILKALEGEWTVTSRSWMKPGEKKAQESSGTSSNSWVLDGRFLKQKYKGEWAGQPFEGIGFTGYDKVKKEYVSIWIDSMSTGIFQANGLYDEATKTIKFGGTFSCPLTGEKNMWFRSEWKIVNNDHNTYTMYMKDPDGKEYKSMELVYKRAK